MMIIMTVATPVSAQSFRDAKGHWAQAAIEKWSDYGVVNGSNGTFKPNADITRAEFAAMLNNTMKYIEKGENPFSDLKSNDWYADAILKLHAAGVLNGSDGKASPVGQLTRQEAAVMIAHAFHMDDTSSTASVFKDNDAIASWAKGAVAALSAKKVLNGMPDGTFQPLSHLTKAEAVTILNNLLQVLITKSGTYSENVQGNALINTGGVTLQNSSISGDLYIAPGVGEGEVTLNNVKIAGSVIVQGGGEHSVILNSVSVGGSLIVNKAGGKIRIVATGTTSVSVVRLESGALLVTKELSAGGGIETVEIPASLAADQKIVLEGTFAKVTNYAKSANITANGTIKELDAQADTAVTGNVTIDKYSGTDGVAITVNDKSVQPGQNSGGGGFFGGGGGGGAQIIAVTGVSIDSSDATMVIGETKTLTATVLPSNATNNKVTWTVADGSTNVITVSQTGVVTAVGKGTKNVKVVTDDGSKTNQIAITVVGQEQAIFTAIEKDYLGTNASRNAIMADLNLITSLPAYPGVSIAWSSDKEGVLSAVGKVTRGNDDQIVNLTATVSGSISGTKTYEMIVREEGVISVETSDYIDSYFADGYPQAYMKNGSLWVRYKLTKPAEVFMTVDSLPDSPQSDIQAVLEGYSGKNRNIDYVGDYPYFNIEASQVNQIQEFQTVSDPGHIGSARVNFVIRDKTNHLSSDVTSILLKHTHPTYEYSPSPFTIAINQALSKIYVHFTTYLNEKSSIVPGDFTLDSAGSITKASIVNSPDPAHGGAYIALDVSGLATNSYYGTLHLSYKGNSLQDYSGRSIHEFSNMVVSTHEQAARVMVSPDRKKVMARIYPSWDSSGIGGIENNPSNRITVSVGDAVYQPAATAYEDIRIMKTFYFTFAEPLPKGNVTLKIDTSGMTDLAMDPFTDPIMSTLVFQLDYAGTPTASYKDGYLKLTFANGFIADTLSSAAGLVVRIGGVDYTLRGFIAKPDPFIQPEKNAWNVYAIDLNDKYSSHIKNVIENAFRNGQQVQVKYMKTNGANPLQLGDSMGTLVDDFDYVTVTPSPN
ncbi:S-layer homology domain-containing protein [Gorillibacterium massiliense]|uniref:S-layer homology domain-containing protein n=1 Tax=Gorillibacterium massiliense TaxID=1280390 RepID=UPI001EE27505|nr:S-layer homology domain-containing protein [Gorillibacterium massiliense]